MIIERCTETTLDKRIVAQNYSKREKVKIELYVKCANPTKL